MAPHPPSTTASSRAARRALLTSAAALSAIAAPAALVASFAGGSSQPVAAEHSIATIDVVHTQSVGDAVRFEDVVHGQVGGVQVVPTTTVPPAPTTTAPAPPAKPAPVVAQAAAAPAPAATGGAYGDPNDPATWDRLARCEASGNWAANTGNGYYGGLQFKASTWRAYGGTGLPHQHSREEQIEIGKRLQARAGWSQWPACTRRLHYR